MDLKQKVDSFFKRMPPLEKPVLLGFSGGEDSLVLLHCLQQLQIPFALAHFDHQWREKSGQEALELEQFAKRNQIEFYSAKSNGLKKSELLAREERYTFFETLFSCKRFQAVVLAHHQMDQMETILKRILEGAHLVSLKGMQPVSYRTHMPVWMPVWRPLLEVSKESIRSYIQKHQLSPIEDQTNFDCTYLRARMRSKIFPLIQENFGKEIAPSLTRIGLYASKMEEYLILKTQHIPYVQGPFGDMIDFALAHPMEIEYFLHSFFKKHKLTPSFFILNRFIQAICDKAANVYLEFAHQKFLIDRQKVFWLKQQIPPFLFTGFLEDSSLVAEKWQWQIQVKEAFVESSSTWMDVWKGRFSFVLPKGEYTFAPICKVAHSKWRKLWNTHKIPAFLRYALPCIVNKEQIPFELYIRKGMKTLSSPYFLVTIEVKARA